MAFDDIVRHGGVVLGHANVADVSSASSEAQKAAYKELFIGLGEVATEQCIAILNGETAQLGLCVGSPNPNAVFPFNWSGTAFGLSHEKLAITGKEVATGDYIVALKQD